MRSAVLKFHNPTSEFFTYRQVNIPDNVTDEQVDELYVGKEFELKYQDIINGPCRKCVGVLVFSRTPKIRRPPLMLEEQL